MERLTKAIPTLNDPINLGAPQIGNGFNTSARVYHFLHWAFPSYSVRRINLRMGFKHPFFIPQESKYKTIYDPLFKFDLIKRLSHIENLSLHHTHTGNIAQQHFSLA